MSDKKIIKLDGEKWEVVYDSPGSLPGGRQLDVIRYHEPQELWILKTNFEAYYYTDKQAAENELQERQKKELSGRIIHMREVPKGEE